MGFARTWRVAVDRGGEGARGEGPASASGESLEG